MYHTFSTTFKSCLSTHLGHELGVISSCLLNSFLWALLSAQHIVQERAEGFLRLVEASAHMKQESLFRQGTMNALQANPDQTHPQCVPRENIHYSSRTRPIDLSLTTTKNVWLCECPGRVSIDMTGYKASPDESHPHCAPRGGTLPDSTSSYPTTVQHACS